MVSSIRHFSGGKAMEIDGACHCGAITYEANLDLKDVWICNCTDCQSLSGSAFRTIGLVPAERFRILSGKPRIYTKVGESGAPRVQAFCENCGSPIYAAAAVERPVTFNIRLGTCRQRESLVPTLQIWHRSALPWLSKLTEVPAKEKQ
jgi:hypothetical protein